MTARLTAAGAVPVFHRSSLFAWVARCGPRHQTLLFAETTHEDRDLPGTGRVYTLDVSVKRCAERKFMNGRVLALNRQLFRACLDNSAMGTQRRQVAGRIQEPEPFPFVDDHSQIFAGEQQLLNATLGSSGIDRQKATDRSREANGQSDQLQGAAHRGFLHERERQCCQRSVTIETLYLAMSGKISVRYLLRGTRPSGALHKRYRTLISCSILNQRKSLA